MKLYACQLVAMLPKNDLIQYISFNVKIQVHEKLTASDKLRQR